MKSKLLLLNLILLLLLEACGGSTGSKTGNNNSSSIALSAASSSSTSSLSRSSNSLTSSSSSSLSANKILISYGDNFMQVGELRLPKIAKKNPSPVIIIIHGGCWVSSYADYHFMDKFADSLTELGYATWNIEYRALGTGGDWPVIFQDVGKAVDYTRELAKNYSIDSNKVAIIGHSAGGHLALWAASRENITSGNEIFTDYPLAIKGVISLAGVANVAASNSCYTFASNVIGLPITSQDNSLASRLKITSPLQMLPTKTKTILISGSKDRIVPDYIGTEYSIRANELGDASLHYILQGLDHFDLIDPFKTNWSLYQQSLQEIFEE